MEWSHQNGAIRRGSAGAADTRFTPRPEGRGNLATFGRTHPS